MQIATPMTKILLAQDTRLRPSGPTESITTRTQARYYLRDYDGFGNNERLNQAYIIWRDISLDESRH